MRYDPAVGPDPTEWLELDDGERIVVVHQYHKRARERAGNPELHAIIHVTVETQLAEGHPEVKAAFERLSREGLDRHNVVHAIGSVLADEIYGVMKSQRQHDPVECARQLKALTAEAWLRGPRNDRGSLPIRPANKEMQLTRSAIAGRPRPLQLNAVFGRLP